LKLELNKDNSGDNVELRCTSAKLISDDQGSAKLLFEFPDAHPLPIEVGYGGLRAIRDAINELLEPSAKNDLN